MRSAYETEVRFWPDSEETVTVRWFRVNPDTEMVPYPTVYRSRNWDKDEWESPIGEVRGADRPWRDGRQPALYEGGAFCGDEKAWAGERTLAEGPVVETGADGYATCCGGHPPRRGPALVAQLRARFPVSMHRVIARLWARWGSAPIPPLEGSLAVIARLLGLEPRVLAGELGLLAQLRSEFLGGDYAFLGGDLVAQLRSEFLGGDYAFLGPSLVAQLRSVMSELTLFGGELDVRAALNAQMRNNAGPIAVSCRTYALGSNTGVTVAAPASILTGDRLRWHHYSNSLGTETITPTGWTQAFQGARAGFGRVWVFQKTAGASEPSTYTIGPTATHTFGAGAVFNVRISAGAGGYTNANATGQPSTGSVATSGTNPLFTATVCWMNALTALWPSGTMPGSQSNSAACSILMLQHSPMTPVLDGPYLLDGPGTSVSYCNQQERWT